MRRTTLILLVALAVVIISGGVYVWLNRTQFQQTIANLSGTTKTNANTNAAVVTNVPLKVINAPVNAHGDTPLTGKLTINGVDLALTSLQRADTYQGTPAGANQTYLQIYIDPIKPEQVQAVNRTLLTNSHLTDGQTTYALQALKISSTLTLNDRGYFLFKIPTAAKNVQLVVGAGTTAQTVTLP